MNTRLRASRSRNALEKPRLSAIINYYLSASSPWTYLGHPRLAALAKLYDATIVLRPVDFGRVFAVSGGLPLPQRPMQRRAYRTWELKRWKAWLEDPMNVEPKYFPVAAQRAAQLIIAAEPLGMHAQMAVAYATMRAVFVEDRNIADRDVMLAVAKEQGVPDTLVAEAEKASVQATYEAYTQEAINHQVFGAPTYILDGEPFWGQDRLDFLERALASRTG